MSVKKFTPEERSKILEDLKASGGSVSAFAKRIGVSHVTLHKWLKEGTAGKRPSTKTKGAKRGGKKPGPYSPDARKQAVEAYLKSGMGLKDFAKVWGVSDGSLWKWVKVYQEQGPRGLESEMYLSTGKKRGRKGLPAAVKTEITETKRKNPEFGLKKVTQFLYRFRGVKVSQGAVRNTLKDAGIPPLPKPKKKRKAQKKIQRFERARAMQLWQSDITSYVLTRHSTRVYLTVFMDDYSRYVVAWQLGLRQTNEFVMETLLHGIQRFGKPEEVLTDQGRQYFAWRGKSDFQKLLHKEGIAHVVARSHHPETLGKCERFWETVGNEFWDRAKPQELAEAKARFEQYVAHYNHFRPHQGLDGMVPADRFFGLESEIRRTIEETLSKNALRLALGEAPRQPVFLIGQIGEERLTLHGERGRLVLQTADGLTKRLDYEDFGQKRPSEEDFGQTKPSVPQPQLKEGESSHESERNGHGNDEGSPQGEDRQQAAQAEKAQQELFDAQDSADSGQSTLGDGEPRAKVESPSVGSRAHGILAGPVDETGAGGEARGPAPSGLAALAAGDLGHGGGSSHPTQVSPAERGYDHGFHPAADDDGASRESESLEKADRGAREDGSAPGAADLGAAGDAGLQASGPDGRGDRGASGSGSSIEQQQQQQQQQPQREQRQQHQQSNDASGRDDDEWRTSDGEKEGQTQEGGTNNGGTPGSSQ